jgi:beta-glucosidase
MGNNSEFDRLNSDSIIDERTMREIYLPAFEAAVKEANEGSVMDSYNLTNGLHLTQNGYFNTDVTKNEWGFKGIMCPTGTPPMMRWARQTAGSTWRCRRENL